MCGWRNSGRLRAGLVAAIAVFVAGCAREPSTPAAATPSTAERVLRVSQRNEPVSLDRIGLSLRGPEESWNMARSTWQVTTSPTRTASRPAARAINFWARV